MRNKVAICLLAGVATLAAACTTSTEPPASTEPSSPTTTAGGGAPGSLAPEHDVDIVGCDEPEDDVAVFCEAYDLVKTRYVDFIDDATLADAAGLGLADLDGANGTGLLVCAAPTDAFDSACDLAAMEADDSTEAAEAMVAGLAAYALDANSAYFDPETLALVEEEQEGEIEGIGALVSSEDETIPGDNKQCSVVSETCRILIVSTIEGAPAEAAGLMRDDAIVGVDGDSILGWTVDEVTTAVRGPAGSSVTLTMERDGGTFDVDIIRAAVMIPVIEKEVVGDVGYVRLWGFTGTAGSQFESAVADLLGEGVGSLVVDLRDNPGGFLTTAIDVTSVFLPDGDVIVTEGPDESLTYSVDGDSIVPLDMPLWFVVNKGSASASEVVSAVLQERGRATVVGENSFGKNTVQQRFDLSNGGALKLTIARWVTPGGLDFGGTGVTPDIELDVAGLDAQELVAAVTDG